VKSIDISQGRSRRKWFCAGIPDGGSEKAKTLKGRKEHFDLSFGSFCGKTKEQKQDNYSTRFGVDTTTRIPISSNWIGALI
jgi:hypothetical protein